MQQTKQSGEQVPRGIHRVVDNHLLHELLINELEEAGADVCSIGSEEGHRADQVVESCEERPRVWKCGRGLHAPHRHAVL